MIVWFPRSPAETKLWSQLPHLYGFSPVCWLRTWIVKWLDVMLEKSHCGHLKGFSPEWTILCSVRDSLRFEAKLHWSHWWDFSPEWVIWCRLIWSNWSEEYLHWLHWWGFSPVCVMICFFRSLSASWYVSLDHYLECMSICIVHTWAASPQNGWACAFSML